MPSSDSEEHLCSTSGPITLPSLRQGSRSSLSIGLEQEMRADLKPDSADLRPPGRRCSNLEVLQLQLPNTDTQLLIFITQLFFFSLLLW